MLRSLYTAGTAMMTQGKRMDVVTNNIANVETTGFKADTLATRSFRDMMIERINDPSVVFYNTFQLNPRHPVGPHNTGIHIDQTFTSFETGPFLDTGLTTDFALQGDGFFTVITPDGDRYTRAGSFIVDGAGMLVSNDGHQVRGQNGPIYVGSEDFSVTPEGDVFVGEAMADRLNIVSFPDNATLRKQGDNLYFNNAPADNPPGASGAMVVQGMLEGSNVDASREVVNMIEISRNYESNQRILRMLDESLGKAVNDIAAF